MRLWTGKTSLLHPGQHLHVDIVFINKVPYLFSVNDFCGYLNLIRMLNKTANSLQHALLALILLNRGHLKVVSKSPQTTKRCSSPALSIFLEEYGVNYRARIPGEYEVDAEREYRTTGHGQDQRRHHGRHPHSEAGILPRPGSRD